MEAPPKSNGERDILRDRGRDGRCPAVESHLVVPIDPAKPAMHKTLRGSPHR